MLHIPSLFYRILTSGIKSPAFTGLPTFCHKTTFGEKLINSTTMKKISLFFGLQILLVAGSYAQISFPGRTPVKQVKQVDPNQPVKMINPTIAAANPTILQQRKQLYASTFTEPSHTLNCPDGQRLTFTLKKNTESWATNMGGNVNVNVQSKAPSTESDQNCVTTVQSVSAQSTSFMNSDYMNQNVNIYPGAIFSFQDFFSGNRREISAARNPITIYTDNYTNTTGPTSVQVPNPNAASIVGYLGTITKGFSTTVGSSVLQYRSFSSENDADLSLKVTAGGSYAGFSASAGVDKKEKEKHIYLTLDIIKPLYTLNAQIPQNGFFVDPNVEKTQNLIVMSSIVYGTRILANLDITIKSAADSIGFQAQYGQKGSVSVDAGFSFIKRSSNISATVNAYVVGGPINTTTFNKDNLEQQIQDLLTRCNYQTAKPISYSFADMAGNRLGIQSATDIFQTRTCTPKSSVYSLSEAYVYFSSGDDNKEAGSKLAIEIYNGNGTITFHQPFEATTTEYPKNAMTTVGLVRHPHANNSDLTLTSLQQNGGTLRLYMIPLPIFLGFDAWKISDIRLQLIFRDQNGIPYPQPINIQLNNARAILDKQTAVLEASFNGGFQGTTSRTVAR
jgi:hypothetical protein